jgi:hypothetical protein
MAVPNNMAVPTFENVYRPEVFDREMRSSISDKLWSSKFVCKELVLPENKLKYFDCLICVT